MGRGRVGKPLRVRGLLGRPRGRGPEPRSAAGSRTPHAPHPKVGPSVSDRHEEPPSPPGGPHCPEKASPRSVTPVPTGGGHGASTAPSASARPSRGHRPPRGPPGPPTPGPDPAACLPAARGAPRAPGPPASSGSSRSGRLGTRGRGGKAERRAPAGAVSRGRPRSLPPRRSGPRRAPPAASHAWWARAQCRRPGGAQASASAPRTRRELGGDGGGSARLRWLTSRPRPRTPQRAEDPAHAGPRPRLAASAGCRSVTSPAAKPGGPGTPCVPTAFTALSLVASRLHPAALPPAARARDRVLPVLGSPESS